jgi:ArsR family transcriptional regulator, arsenate/arsenite/antimonite-responsive transcriptional repressor
MPATIRLRAEPAGCCRPALRTGDRARARRDAPAHAALGDEVRLTILRLLARQPELCVCEIQRAFALGQPTISHHLRVLREAGLVACEKRGLWAYYSLRPDAVRRLARSLTEVL